MLTAADALHEAHPRLDRLVRRAEARTGSRMLAYGEVARGIGASPSWVRKVLGRQSVGMPGHVILNILTAYDTACARWDAEAALEKERFHALGRESHALAEITTERMGLEEGSGASRGGAAAGLVPHLVGDQRGELSEPLRRRRRA